MDKVTGFKSDEGNVMVGSRSGVATKLKWSTLMLSIHCVNHRLALGATQSVSQFFTM